MLDGQNLERGLPGREANRYASHLLEFWTGDQLGLEERWAYRKDHSQLSDEDQRDRLAAAVLSGSSVRRRFEDQADSLEVEVVDHGVGEGQVDVEDHLEAYSTDLEDQSCRKVSEDSHVETSFRALDHSQLESIPGSTSQA